MQRRMTSMSLVLAASLIAGSALVLPGVPGREGSGAALAQDKTQARKDLKQVETSLRAVDTAYASGNAAEAQSRFDEARAGWNKVSPMISAREAREQQLLFDNLGQQLKTNAPPAKVRGTVSGMLEELREDIAEELK
jgi:hypothetical protein